MKDIAPVRITTHEICYHLEAEYILKDLLKKTSAIDLANKLKVKKEVLNWWIMGIKNPREKWHYDMLLQIYYQHRNKRIKKWK